MKFLDRTKLFQKYRDKWVALTEDDEVIAHGRTFERVLKKAKNMGYDNPVMTKIPNLKYSYLLS